MSGSTFAYPYVSSDTSIRQDAPRSIDLVMSVAGYFKLNETKSNAILNEMQGMISKWNDVAKNMGISNEERQRMRVAFNR